MTIVVGVSPEAVRVRKTRRPLPVRREHSPAQEVLLDRLDAASVAVKNNDLDAVRAALEVSLDVIRIATSPISKKARRSK